MNMVSTPMAGEEEEGGYSEAELVSLASISDLDLGTQPPLFEAEVRAAPANTNTSFPEVASGSRRQRSGSDVFEMTRPKVRCKKIRNRVKLGSQPLQEKKTKIYSYLQNPAYSILITSSNIFFCFH